MRTKEQILQAVIKGMNEAVQEASDEGMVNPEEGLDNPRVEARVARTMILCVAVTFLETLLDIRDLLAFQNDIMGPRPGETTH